MFIGLGPMPNLIFPAIFGVLGSAAGWWIERRIRRWRLFRKLSKVAAAKLPESVSLNKLDSHSWTNTVKYEQSKAAFESLGFQRGSIFIASPQKWVVEFWLGTQPRLFAKI